MRTPVKTTFDTNTYSVVARPQVKRLVVNLWPLNRNRLKSIRDRLCWWYLNWCIRRGRIVAAIPEGVLKAEVVPIAERVSALLAVGTAAAANAPRIGQTRLEIIRAAFDTGFRVLRSPRIAWGALFPVPEERWAPDEIFTQAERLDRESVFIRHFNNYPLEAIKDYGEQLSKAHGLATSAKAAQYGWIAAQSKTSLDRILWREGLAAEEASPAVELSVPAFQTKLRALMADWVDFDVAAVHYAYGYNILCSQDRGRNLTSIFSATHAGALQSNVNRRWNGPPDRRPKGTPSFCVLGD